MLTPVEIKSRLRDVFEERQADVLTEVIVSTYKYELEDETFKALPTLLHFEEDIEKGGFLN